MNDSGSDPGYRGLGALAVLRFVAQFLAMLAILLITVPWVAITAVVLLLFSGAEWCFGFLRTRSE